MRNYWFFIGGLIGLLMGLLIYALPEVHLREEYCYASGVTIVASREFRQTEDNDFALNSVLKEIRDSDREHLLFFQMESLPMRL